MEGNVAPKPPVTWLVTMILSEQERDDLAFLFYKLKDGQTSADLPTEQRARVNNLALPLYQLFDDGVTPP